ncbi:ABC transporter permease subunit [Micromonospora arborensis]|uniref:ABC transporter permease subunit n=1 Tax=Micromonospora arborensis TaxID=2116518 RepID=UPI0033DA6702
MSSLSSAVSFEMTKARTVMSTVWSLILCFLVSVAIALLFGWVLRGAYDDMSPEGKAGFDPVASGYNGLRLGMIALVVFGVMLVSSEFSTGTIRSSLAAVPDRGRFYAAKIITGTAIALAVSVITTFVTFFTAQTAIGSARNASITDKGALQATMGAIIYMTLLCTLSMGVATVLRSPALSLGILVPLFFMVSEILNNLPGVQKVAQFLPDAAGQIMMRGDPPESTVLNGWTGLGLLTLWTVAALFAGYASLRRRDV